MYHRRCLDRRRDARRRADRCLRGSALHIGRPHHRIARAGDFGVLLGQDPLGDESAGGVDILAEVDHAVGGDDVGRDGGILLNRRRAGLVARPALPTRSGNVNNDAVGIQVGDARHWPNKAILVDQQRTGHAHFTRCLEMDFGSWPDIPRSEVIETATQHQRCAVVHRQRTIAASRERLVAIDRNRLCTRGDGGQRR